VRAALRPYGALMEQTGNDYALRIDEDAVDASVFEKCCRQGRAEARQGRLENAVRHFRDALALWRGPALDGVPGEVVRSEAARLEELRRIALTERIDLDLRLGRHEEVVADLQAAIQEDMLNERWYGQLMLALYRAGRQSEAVETFNRARKVLIEELGQDPGPGLRSLHQKILLQAPELDLDHAQDDGVPRQLPARPGWLVGRTAEVAQAAQALSSTVRRHPPIVAITGHGGVGKTAVALDAAYAAGYAYPDGQLYADLGAGGSRPAEVLAGFLRALGMQELPDGLDQQAAAFRSILARRRVLVFLDSVRSAEEVRLLSPANPQCGMIVTSRYPLTDLPGATLLPLSLLSPEDSRRLLEEVVGAERLAAEPEATEQVIEACGGMPLACRISAARLAAARHRPVRWLADRLADSRRRLDELAFGDLAVRSSLEVSYRALSEQHRRMLGVVAYLGMSEIAAWEAAALADLGVLEAENILDELVTYHLLDARDGEWPYYRLHDLVALYARERAEAEMSPAELTEALARVCGGWLALYDEVYTTIHGRHTVRLTSPAPRWHPPDMAISNLVTKSAYAWFDHHADRLMAMVRRAAEARLDDQCWDLLLGLAYHLALGDHFDEWKYAGDVALTAVREADNKRGEAAVLYSQGERAQCRQEYDEAIALLEASAKLFEKVGDDYGHGLARSDLAHVRRIQGDLALARDDYVAAIALLDAAGDLLTQAAARRGLARIEQELGHYAEARDILLEAHEQCRRVGGRRVEAQILHSLSELAVTSGDLVEAEARLRRARTICEELHDPVGEAYTAVGLGELHTRTGRFDDAQESLLHAVETAMALKNRLLQGRTLLALGELNALRGLHGLARRDHLAARHLFTQLGATRWVDKAEEALRTLQQREDD